MRRATEKTHLSSLELLTSKWKRDGQTHLVVNKLKVVGLASQCPSWPMLVHHECYSAPMVQLFFSLAVFVHVARSESFVYVSLSGQLLLLLIWPTKLRSWGDERDAGKQKQNVTKVPLREEWKWSDGEWDREKRRWKRKQTSEKSASPLMGTTQ